MDDQNVMAWSIGRTVKFCPEAGEWMNKTGEEIEDEKEKREDELFMKELSKIADTTIVMLKTEADSPGQHPELNFKVPILDIAVWVETGNCLPQGRKTKASTISAVMANASLLETLHLDPKDW